MERSGGIGEVEDQHLRADRADLAGQEVDQSRAALLRDPRLGPKSIISTKDGFRAFGKGEHSRIVPALDIDFQEVIEAYLGGRRSNGIMDHAD